MKQNKNFLDHLDGGWGDVIADTYNKNQNTDICKFITDEAVEYKIEVSDPYDIQLIIKTLDYSREPLFSVKFTSNKNDIKFTISDNATNKYYEVGKFEFIFNGLYNLYNINIGKPEINIIVCYNDSIHPRNILAFNNEMNNDIIYLNDTIIKAIIKEINDIIDNNSDTTENEALLENIKYLNNINK